MHIIVYTYARLPSPDLAQLRQTDFEEVKVAFRPARAEASLPSVVATLMIS